jgi:hypothetical protein
VWGQGRDGEERTSKVMVVRLPASDVRREEVEKQREVER